MVDRFLNSNIRFQTNLIDGDQAGEDQLNNGARFELSVSECMSAFEEEEKKGKDPIVKRNFHVWSDTAGVLDVHVKVEKTVPQPQQQGSARLAGSAKAL